MNEISILVGGKAGHGIRVATTLIARLLSRYGYRAFVYDDYPSLIRGGHNFSIVRAAEKKILANTKNVDVIVAFDKQTAEKHAERLKEAAEILGLKVVQPIVMEPFPDLSELGDKKVITVEVNATAQLARLLSCNGIEVDGSVLKYDGRPFFVDELVERLEEVLQ